MAAKYAPWGSNYHDHVCRCPGCDPQPTDEEVVVLADDVRYQAGVCYYCTRTEDLRECFICGRPCCWEVHAWEMREEVKAFLGFGNDAIECVDCVCK